MSDSKTICHCERERERDITICQCQNDADRLTTHAQSEHPARTLWIRNIFYSKDFLYRNLVHSTTLPSAGQNNMALCLPSGFIAITITCLISPTSLLNPSFYNTTFGQRKTNKKNNPEFMLVSCHNRSQDWKY